LKDPEWNVRESAAETLGYYSSAGSKSIRPLIDCLQDEHMEVRRNAILALGRLGKGVVAVEQALTPLATDPNPVLKDNAIIALAIIGKRDDSVLPLLANSMGSKVESTASGACLALGKIGQESPEKVMPSLMEALNSNEEPLLSNALKVFRQMKGHADKVLPQVANRFETVDKKNRVAVLQAVNEMDVKGDHALSLCIKAMKDTDPLVRKEALIGAMRYRSRLEPHLKSLIDFLEDPEEENKLVAIGIVKGFGHNAAGAQPQLINSVKDGSPRVRIAALSALGSFAETSQDALQLLESSLADSDEKIRMASLSALRNVGQRKPNEVIPILEKVLEKEKGQRMKRSIISALDSLKRSGQSMPNR
jgi:HEAT repeat protein